MRAVLAQLDAHLSKPRFHQCGNSAARHWLSYYSRCAYSPKDRTAPDTCCRQPCEQRLSDRASARIGDGHFLAGPLLVALAARHRRRSVRIEGHTAADIEAAAADEAIAVAAGMSAGAGGWRHAGRAAGKCNSILGFAGAFRRAELTSLTVEDVGWRRDDLIVRLVEAIHRDCRATEFRFMLVSSPSPTSLTRLPTGAPLQQVDQFRRPLDEIKQKRGSQFDPGLAEIFIALVERIHREHADLDEFLSRGSQTSPYVQARERIRLIIKGRRYGSECFEALRYAMV